MWKVFQEETYHCGTFAKKITYKVDLVIGSRFDISSNLSKIKKPKPFDGLSYEQNPLEKNLSSQPV